MKSDLYISRKVMNTKDFADWALSVGFTSMMPEDSLHVTQVFCKTEVEWEDIDRDEPEIIFIDAGQGKRSVHNFDGGACVLEFVSKDMKDRSNALKKIGVKSSHPQYRSHITISYKKPDDLKVEDIKPYDGYIVLGPEIFEPINKEWKNSIEEIPLTKEAELTEAKRNENEFLLGQLRQWINSIPLDD